MISPSRSKAGHGALPEAPSSEEGPERAIPIRWGACLAVSLPLIVANCGWIANAEVRTFTTEGTISTLFMGVTFILFLLTLINLWVRRRSPRAAMNQPELMVCYTLLSISSVIAGVGHYGFLTPFLTDSFYYDRPSNGWKGFWYLLPPYIGPRNPDVLHGFYDGESTFFRPHIIAAWLPPLAMWGAFYMVLLWTTLCLAAIVRQRWQDEEHLPFPVIALPLEMTKADAPLYRQKLLWAGFSVPLVLHSLNSLASIVPGLPTLKINSTHDLAGTINLSLPWSGVDTLFYQLHPVGLGFGYLVSTDVSFSLWFFYLLKKALNVWGVAEGWRDPGNGSFGDAIDQFPLTGYQGWGAWIGFSLLTLWANRAYISGYVRRAFRGDPDGIDRHEALSARTAVFGFFAGFAAMTAFFRWNGGSWWLPIAFLGIYILIMVAITRLRAEVAVLCTELIWINPQSILPAMIGTGSMQSTDLANISIMTSFNMDYRAAGMPHELEGIVGLRKAGAGSLRPLVGAILLAALVAIVSASIWDLQMYYTQGADTGNVNSWRTWDKGTEPWDHLAKWLHHPAPLKPKAYLGMAIGFAITCLLTVLRMRIPGFPLHPAAYVINTSFANDFFWCDMFVAWAIKSLLVRYGGAGVYRKGLPFFLGLILGDFVTGSIWSIIGAVFNLDLFRTFAT